MDKKAIYEICILRLKYVENIEIKFKFYKRKINLKIEINYKLNQNKKSIV